MNSDKILPEIEIELGGEVRKLKFGFKALLRLEQLTGLNLLRGQMDFAKLENVRSLLWAALIEHQPELDASFSRDGEPSEELKAILGKVESWIEISRLVEIVSALMNAFDRATSSGQDNSQGKTNPALENASE